MFLHSLNRRLPILFICAIALAGCGDDSTGTDGDDDAGGWIETDAGADAASDAADASPAAGVVSTTEGPVRGQSDDGVWSFLGLPYAKPPVGGLRWRAPQPPEPRSDTFEADAFGPSCPQSESAFQFGTSGTQNEDCLTLNIWTPDIDPNQPLSVMVWIHGGGFIQGSSKYSLNGTYLYDGADLSEENVVVVTLNYRLGALGFLAHEAFIGEGADQPKAGNYGLLDQTRALEWVRDNISNFGGDPTDITVFGESAGGVSVCALMASPLADGLFDSAVMQSGNCLERMRRLDEQFGEQEAATDQGARFAEAIGCKGADDVAACLRSKSTDQILNTLPGTVGNLGDGESYGLIVDGHALDQTVFSALEDGSAAEVPFVLGVNADEGTLFVSGQRGLTKAQYEAAVRSYFPQIGDEVLSQYPSSDYSAPWKALAAIVGDTFFVCPTRQAARAHTASGSAAFTYYFGHVTAPGRQWGLGAFHASEIPFVFGNYTWAAVTGAERDLGASMQTYWTQFATDGAPGSADGLSWPVYEASADKGMYFEAGGTQTTSGFRSDYCDFWDNHL